MRATKGVLHSVRITGPLGAPVDASVGFLGGSAQRTAVIDIAAACGLSLMAAGSRDPKIASSFGVGELIRAALDRGASRILIGCGDSGVNDGGAGMIQALGGRLLDADGQDIARGGVALSQLAAFDLSAIDKRLSRTSIEACVNWQNLLLGPRGVTRVYGKQKGASDADIESLDAAIENFAAKVRQATGVDVGSLNGAGASGGIGAALAAILGATLRPRFEFVSLYLNFDALLAAADVVITDEGSIDSQTPFGKIPAEIGRRAAALGKPVIALAGQIGVGAAANHAHGVTAFASITDGPRSEEESFANARQLIESTAEQSVRILAAGLELKANFLSRGRAFPARSNTDIGRAAA